MSYTIDLIVGPLPQDESQAWQHVETLRASYYGDAREKAPALLDLHAALTERYPCLCSYADDDPAMDESPWADGPMIGNFAHEMGMLAISFSRADEVVPFVVAEANARGITVVDGQSELIHRPRVGARALLARRGWWKFWE